MPVPIIDVRAQDGSAEEDLRAQIIDGLTRPVGEKELPTILLYDEHGLRLFDAYTTEAKEYYIYGAELEILKNYSDEIVRAMHRGRKAFDGREVVLELGAGALRKTLHILSALGRLVPEAKPVPPVTYYALDLDGKELRRTLGNLACDALNGGLDGRVAVQGMWGTYEDGIRFVRNGCLRSGGIARDTLCDGDITSQPSTDDDSLLSTDSPPLHILFFGSSFGNFQRDAGAAFLRTLPLRPGSGDTLLLAMDHVNDKDKIEAAYNDSQGYGRACVMNALRHAARVLGDEDIFDDSQWEYVNSHDPQERRHQEFLVSRVSQTMHAGAQTFSFIAGEKVKLEESNKFSADDVDWLLSAASLRPLGRWSDRERLCSLWLLEREENSTRA
ncbi:histidine-specific methyltransferase [Schizophyllum commune]